MPYLSRFHLSLPLLVALGVYTQQLVVADTIIGDPDTYWHIAHGRWIIAHRAVPHEGIFSATMPHGPWVAHEWLGEVVLAGLFDSFGWAGLVAVTALCVAMALAMLLRVLLRSLEPVHALVATVLAYFLTMPHILARPHIFSLLLMVVWYYLLDAFQYGGKNRLWLCPPLMLIWVNLHAGFITGFIMLGIYLTGNLIRSIADETEKKGAYRKKYRTLALITLLCLAAALINPFGYHILLFPFSLVDNKFLMDHVQEFVSPNFHEPLPFKYFFFLMIAIFAISRERLNFMEIALILFFTNMALYSVRYIPLLAIIAAPIMLRKAGQALDESPGRFSALPARGSAMYAPELKANSAEFKVIVTD
jgi:hypothetical protein